MSIEDVLDNNAITLSALRNACLEYDNINIHLYAVDTPPYGLAVFSSVVRRTLHDCVSEEVMLRLTDTSAWYQAMHDQKDTCFIHASVKVRVEDIRVSEVEDVSPEKHAAVLTDAKLEVLKEGCDPEDPNSWVPVSNILSAKLGGDNESR